MTDPRQRNRLRRGQPLIALGLLLTAWVGARAVLYEDAVPVSAAPEVKPEVLAAPAIRPAASAPSAPAPQMVARPAPAPQRPFVAAPEAAPDFERLRLAEGHQLLWQEAVAPRPEAATVAEPAPEATVPAE